jgi:hypothetical protein
VRRSRSFFNNIIHTFIYSVGYKFYSNDLLADLKLKRLCWPNTIELSLSIKHSSEIIYFFQNGALPSIEHLNITNEEMYTILPEYHYKHENIKFYKNELNETVNGTRLKSLFLRYIFLSDIIILINSLTMSLLEKLTLIDLYDHSKFYINFY